MKTIFISDSVKYISKKNDMLCLSFKDNSIKSYSLSDVSIIVVESLTSTISTQCIAMLADHNIITIFPNTNYLPASINIPLTTHNLIGKISKYQTNLSSETKSSLWLTIINNKISNQIKVLAQFNLPTIQLQRILESSLDVQQKESQAARLYFKLMFDNDFKRKDVNSINDSLNYGYSILRSKVARTLIGFGILPYFGLYHSNQHNALPLVDDIMEVLRPVVDYIVKTNLNENLDLTLKKKLLMFEENECFYDNKKVTIETGIQNMILSFKDSLETNSNKMKFINIYEKV